MKPAFPEAAFMQNSLLLKIQFAQEPNRSSIFWHHLCFNSMKAHVLETKLDHSPHGLCHDSLTPIGPGKIIPEFGIVPYVIPGNIPACSDDSITVFECDSPTKALFLFKAVSLPFN